MINFIRNYWEVFVIGVLLILALAVQLMIDARSARHRKVEQPPVKPGTERYSPFFESYLAIVTYDCDEQYTFRVLEGKRRGQVLHNKSPWSSLPLKSPGDAAIEHSQRSIR